MCLLGMHKANYVGYIGLHGRVITERKKPSWVVLRHYPAFA
jgi:hypothetical protein